MKIAIVGDIHDKNQTPRKRLDIYSESLDEKLDFILSDKTLSHVLHLGDLFSKSTATEERKNILISKFRDAKNRGLNVSTILGNHDFPNDNFDEIKKTAFYNIVLSEAIAYLAPERSAIIDNVLVVALPYYIKRTKEYMKKDLIDLINKSNCQKVVILGHHMYEFGLCRDASITIDMLKELDSAKKNIKDITMFLGHDHRYYDPITAGSVTLYRPGSVMREELSEYNITRIPCYYVYDTATSKVEKVEIPCKSAQEIFNLKEFTTNKQIKRTFDEIKLRLSGLNIRSEQPVVKMSDELRKLSAPEQIIDYIQSLYMINNLDF